jgi:hypothetical protein
VVLGWLDPSIFNPVRDECPCFLKYLCVHVVGLLCGKILPYF